MNLSSALMKQSPRRHQRPAQHGLLHVRRPEPDHVCQQRAAHRQRQRDAQQEMGGVEHRVPQGEAPLQQAPARQKGPYLERPVRVLRGPCQAGAI